MIELFSEKKIKNKYGKCEYEFKDDYVHIFNLFVLPKHRKKGVATKLLKTAIRHIRRTGWIGEIQIVAIPIEKSINIDRLKKFYVKMGLRVFDYYG